MPSFLQFGAPRKGPFGNVHGHGHVHGHGNGPGPDQTEVFGKANTGPRRYEARSLQLERASYWIRRRRRSPPTGRDGFPT